MSVDLGIDHNIKKQWIPFSLNKNPEGVNTFTFRRYHVSGSQTLASSYNELRLRICPSQDIMEQLSDGQLSDGTAKGGDVANQLLFPQSGINLFLTEILNKLPAIQIREFLQDSRINEIENLFSMFTKGMKFFDENKDKKPKNKACIVQKLRTAVQNAITGAVKTLNDSAKTYIGGNIDCGINDFEYASVMSIPYLLYTKLIASTTQNYYILPYNGKAIFDTDGTYGYAGTGGLKGWSSDSNSLLGKALNFVGAQVRVDTTPRFSAGGDSRVTTIKVTLDLFNDSKWGAITNFIMINTLFPGNMWMQYHLFNVAPNLYDIKVEGLQRLYMCTGQFKCDCKGQLRTPSEDFWNSLKTYIVNPEGNEINKANNFNTKKGLAEKDYYKIVNNSLIKIPDVYSLDLTFTSLLPDNLNSYLWQFSNNNNVIEYNDGIPRDGFGSKNNDIQKFLSEVNGKVSKIMKDEGVIIEEGGTK